MGIEHQDLALRIRNAYGRVPIPPLRDGLDPLDAAGAYAVQHINTRHWVQAGRRIIGRKVGLTASAVQKQLGVDQPDFGVLFGDMQIEDGGILLASQTLQPKAEAEVAIVLKADLRSADCSIDDVLAATDYAITAIEIVDSRISDWKITLADTIADNGSSAFFVLGSQKMPLEGLDLYTCGMVMTIDDVVMSLGAGAACLGHPLRAAQWLARTLSKNGDYLRAGDLILTGALGPMVTLTPGTAISASVGGIGSVSFSFAHDLRSATSP
jgi:2-keto-4-pentenoate hydratase